MVWLTMTGMFKIMMRHLRQGMFSCNMTAIFDTAKKKGNYFSTLIHLFLKTITMRFILLIKTQTMSH